MFCPKCGSILLAKKDGNKRIMNCPKCSYKSSDTSVATIKEENMEKTKEVEIVDEADGQTYPVVDQECSQCKNKKAYFWLVQTRASDEPETKFYKCTEFFVRFKPKPVPP